MINPVLACESLTKKFIDGAFAIPVLNQVDFSVMPGETVAIIGASGSGKSTLLQLLGGLDEPSSGEVYWSDKAVYQLSQRERCQMRNRHLGFVYQFHHLLPEFSALENVALPLLIRGDSPELAINEAQTILKAVGLGARLQHRSNQLSGGERQRVALARALVTRPHCVLADEPTGNLDESTATDMLDLMLSLQKTVNTSFVVVTHDTVLARRFGKCYALREGCLHHA